MSSLRRRELIACSSLFEASLCALERNGGRLDIDGDFPEIYKAIQGVIEVQHLSTEHTLALMGVALHRAVKAAPVLKSARQVVEGLSPGDCRV